VILNETLARKVFEEQNPVGREIPLWGNPCQIVGVAANARNSGLAAAPDPELYVLRSQTPNAISANQRPPFGWRQAIAVIRSNLGEAAAAETLRLAMEHTDPSIALVMGSLNLQMNGFLARPRFQTAVLLFFAFLGLLLAAFGLYGLTSFLAAERTREVGIRIALGATPLRIVALMMKDGLRWSVFGLALGLAATTAIGRWLQSNLYQTKPLDSGVLLASVAVLGITVVWGTLLPSLRASRTDPAVALRRE
jgi:ABC-type lipoprotein release transport system permease subunit